MRQRLRTDVALRAVAHAIGALNVVPAFGPLAVPAVAEAQRGGAVVLDLHDKLAVAARLFSRSRTGVQDDRLPARRRLARWPAAPRRWASAGWRSRTSQPHRAGAAWVSGRSFRVGEKRGGKAVGAAGRQRAPAPPGARKTTGCGTAPSGSPSMVRPWSARRTLPRATLTPSTACCAVGHSVRPRGRAGRAARPRRPRRSRQQAGRSAGQPRWDRACGRFPAVLQDKGG